MIEKIRCFIDKHETKLLLLLTTGVSILVTAYYFYAGQIVAYGDAESHLNIAKRVVSGLTPGFGQLGGNWLPLHHIMMIPFIWNDALWRTGIAGSIVSMYSFILSAIFIYKTTNLITKSTWASIAAYILFITNPNILYMQSTPMGELPLLLSLTGSVYFLVKWMKTDYIIDLILSAIFVLIGSLIRYDAWAISSYSVLAIVFVGIAKHMSKAKIESRIIAYSTISFIGLVGWLVWNKLIFNDWLYFLLSPYSAHAQQLAWLERGQLPSYKNVANSFAFYSLAAAQNTGTILAIFSVLAFLTVSVMTVLKKFRFSHYVVLLLFFVPYLFYVLTLYLGISIILVSELLPKSYQFRLFNIRYGLMMMPFVSVFIGVFLSRTKKIGPLLLLLMLIPQLYLFSQEKYPVTLNDAVVGLSGRRPGPVNTYVAQHYDHGLIMFDDFSRSANPIDLGVPMNKIVYVGNHPMWDISLEHPTQYVRWYIVRHDENDVLWQKFKNNKEFIQNFQAVYRNDKTYVYKRVDR